MKQSPARLVIADDHRLLADACRRLLEPEFQVVAVVTDGRALINAAVTLKPDIVIVDIAMPLLNGLDAAERIKQRLPSVKLVFLTMSNDAELAAEAFRRGAAAYVLKQSSADELVTAIRKVQCGQSYLSPLITRETVTLLLDRGKCRDDSRRLTGRQSEILQLLAEGMSMKLTASVLGITPGTVAFHKYRMMETLGVKTNAELLRYAMNHGLLCA
ncbi:MAG: response regulator transcription factor [Candidatus Korobacteraceae bacterium]